MAPPGMPPPGMADRIDTKCSVSCLSMAATTLWRRSSTGMAAAELMKHMIAPILYSMVDCKAWDGMRNQLDRRALALHVARDQTRKRT